MSSSKNSKKALECPRCKGLSKDESLKGLLNINHAVWRPCKEVADTSTLWVEFASGAEYELPARSHNGGARAELHQVFVNLKKGDTFEDAVLTKQMLEVLFKAADFKKKDFKAMNDLQAVAEQAEAEQAQNLAEEEGPDHDVSEMQPETSPSVGEGAQKPADDKSAITNSPSSSDKDKRSITAANKQHGSRLPTNTSGKAANSDKPKLLNLKSKDVAGTKTSNFDNSKQVATPSFNLRYALSVNSNAVDSARAPTHDFAVYDNCPVNVISDQEAVGSGLKVPLAKVQIATNYVTVDKVPQKLYVYSVQYVALKQDSELDAVTQDLARLGMNSNSTASSDDEARLVTRRSEQRLVWKALEETAPFKDRQDWATDLNTLWSLKPIENADVEPLDGQPYNTGVVEYKKTSWRTAKVDHVNFTFNRIVEFDRGSATTSLVNPQDVDEKGASLHVTALNALVSKHVTTDAKNNTIPVGPNKFYLKDGAKSMINLNAHRGYFSSARPGSDRILLNVSTITGSFIPPQKVSDWLRSMNDRHFAEYGTIENLLIGKQIRICYDRAKLDDDYDPNDDDARIRTIASFGEVPSVQKFKIGDRTWSVKKYFEDVLKCKVQVKDDQPCVNVWMAPKMKTSKDDSGKKTTVIDEDHPSYGKQAWIPPEFVEIVPHQPFGKRLCAVHMEAMLKAAQHHPSETQSLIVHEGLPLLGLDEQQNAGLGHLGLQVNPKLLEISAIILEPPRIWYGGSILRDNVEAASWNIEGAKFKQAGAPVEVATAGPAKMVLPINKAADKGYKSPNGPAYPLKQGVYVIDFRAGSYDANVARRLGPDLTKRLQDHGIELTAMSGYVTSADLTPGSAPKQPAQFSDAELEAKVSVQLQKWSKPGVILVILDSTDSSNYASIKRIFDQHLGVHTVCLTSAKVGSTGPGLQIRSNLALKVNMKLRGINHEVAEGDVTNPKSIFKNLPSDTMVIGADVSHAPSQMSSCPSVAAVVGSDDEAFANFPGSVRLQASGQEIIENLEDMVRERVKQYIVANKKAPKYVLFYRDGVGEDQYETVRTVEIKRVETGFDNARKEFTGAAAKQKGYKIHKDELKMTFIVVGKRHNTRFFPRSTANTTPSERNGKPTSATDAKLLNGNCKPGLLVDTVITRPDVGDGIWDFFLQSHEALKGTAKSAHYVVLRDDGMERPLIKVMTHAFCYNFARATKGVSYAGPAYYADRLADRGTHYLKGFTNNHPKEPPWKVDGVLGVTAEQDARTKKERQKAYAAEVARRITLEPAWNPRITDLPNRRNPWHPSFDDRMFWL